ncbi:retrovirus-related pol polyprotein from transposon TNT 1-94, partial [Tanacetum coccineum]
MNVVNHSETEITSDSSIISYSQYVIESQQVAVQNSNSSTQQDTLILSVIEQLKNQVVANCTKINLENKSVNDTLTPELERYKEHVKVLNEGQNVALTCNENVSDSSAQSVEIDRLKQTLFEHLKEKESLMQTISLLKDDFKKEESRNIDREIALKNRIKQLDNIVFKIDQSAQTVHMLTKPQCFYAHTTKQALGFQNPFYLKKAQQLEPKLYVGNVIEKTNAIVIPYSEETLLLAEESHSKMLLKQKDAIMLEKKVNTTQVDYVNSMNSPEPNLSSRPTIVEVPKELPKVSMVNTSLKKLKHHLTGFNVVVKERTTPTAITEGSWGFEHIEDCFRDKIIPFVKALKDLFNTFNQYLVDEVSEVQNVFHQMEQAIEQHRLESKTFEVKMNHVLNENERLLEQVISKDIVNILVNSSVNIASVNVHECEKCLKLETELLNKKDFVEKEIYDKLFKSFTTLEKHCISLEVDTQHNQEIFQRDNSISNQSAPSCPNCSLIGNVTISRDYYVEGLGHNLFSVGKFCDSNLEVAFCQHTCFIRNLEGVDLLTGSRGKNLYTLSLGDIMESSPISRHGLVRGLPKLKFEKDHLCSACAMGKSKKKSHKPKSEDTNQEKLYLLHMDLYGPIRVASVNGKEYILVIVDDYSRFTWVKFLRSKDEAPDFIIKFLKMIQVRLKVPVRRIKKDNGTEFVNQTLQAVATACYTQNRSIVRLRHGKTPYELLHDKPTDLSFFHVFGALCYPTNDSENLDFDELTAMDSEHSSSGAALHEMTPVIITPEVIALIAEVVAPVHDVSTGSPSSTTVDQDAPLPSNFQTTPETQPPLIPNDVKEDNHDIEVAHIGNDPYFGIPILEVPSDQSSSSDSIHIIVHPDHQIYEHNSKWTKDHPLENIIGELARPVSIRLQLH